MKIEVSAQARKTQGTGASRRLRRSGKVPGIVYGGKSAAAAIELDHSSLFQQMRKEAFHASILSLNVDGNKEDVLLRAVNMHPWRLQIDHIDFQRVSADSKIHMKVPLHFVNAEVSPGVKESGGVVSHVLTELDISCLPKDLPGFIEVDLSNMAIGHSVHVADLKLPEGVTAVVHKKENPVVATVQIPRALVVAEDTPVAEAAVEGEAAAGAAAAPAAGGAAAPAAGAKAPAAGAKAAAGGKEAAKPAAGAKAPEKSGKK
jgi:large subunit ribosomal protein L25